MPRFSHKPGQSVESQDAKWFVFVRISARRRQGSADFGAWLKNECRFR
jgi:hypothetical protein